MDEEELNFEGEENRDGEQFGDALLPPEMPPIPDTSAPVATGQDQDAGQAQESGQAPAPPAYRTPEAVPPRAETATPFSLDVPTVHYSGFDPPPLPPVETPKPVDFPPVPRVRNPGRERRHAMRKAKRLESMGASHDAELLEMAAAKEASDASTELNDEWVRLWEKQVRAINGTFGMVALHSKILDDILARLLDLERWAQTFTRNGR